MRKVLKSLVSVNLAFCIFGGAAPAAEHDSIESILASAGLGSAKVSIKIVRLPEGQVLYEKDPDRLLNPASNVKIITAAAALASLGPDYTFQTEFWSDKPLRKGRIGRLWVKGKGDPAFVTEELEAVVETLKAQGLERIDGDIFLDDSYFDRDHLMTYISDLDGRRYRIVTGPLSFNFNTAMTEPRRERRRGRRSRRGSRQSATLNLPKLPPGQYDPTLYAGTAIVEALRAGGITVGGQLKREAVPRSAIPLWTHTSPPLSEILKGMGKFSNNFIAEQLVKTMGADRDGPPGSTRKGLAVLQTTLDTLQIPRDAYRLENGSGLAKGNLFSASQFVTVLKSLAGSSWNNTFLSSLSVAGVDGTLKRKWRRSPMKGRFFAKTGSLSGVQALSGYVEKRGTWVAFSILFNDFSIPADRVTKVEEKILLWVWEQL